MSGPNYIASIAVYQGAQSKFYIVDGEKYHIRFPMEWAHNHFEFTIDGYVMGTGPKECGNCKVHGGIRGVFVGYCANCLSYYSNHTSDPRGECVMDAISIELMSDEYMRRVYPYMYGTKKIDIGDDENYSEEEAEFPDLVLSNTEVDLLQECLEEDDQTEICDNIRDDELSIASEDEFLVMEDEYY